MIHPYGSARRFVLGNRPEGRIEYPASGYSRLDLGVFGVHVENLVTQQLNRLHNVHTLPHQVGGIHIYPDVLETADPFVELKELGGGEHGVGGMQFPSQFHSRVLSALIHFFPEFLEHPVLVFQDF